MLKQVKNQSHVNGVFNYCGGVHKELFPTGQTFKEEYYLGLLRSLRKSIREKRP